MKRVSREKDTRFFNKNIDFLIDTIYHIRNKNEVDNEKAVIIRRWEKRITF